MSKKWKTLGRDGCDDCQWIANETDGEILICDECDWEDDGQPDAMQEWHDFDPDCQEVVMNTFRIIMEMIRTVVPIAILVIQLMILQGFSL